MHTWFHAHFDQKNCDGIYASSFFIKKGRALQQETFLEFMKGKNLGKMGIPLKQKN